MSKPKPPLRDTVSYRCGYDLSHPQPVYFELVVVGPRGKATLPTTWTMEDAEGMAYALLKNVELCRRRMLELKTKHAELQEARQRLVELQQTLPSHQPALPPAQ